MKQIILYAVTTLALLTTMGCANTHVKTSWQAPGLGHIDNVIVFVKTDKISVRSLMEDTLVKHLQEVGIHAESSVRIFSAKYDIVGKSLKRLIADTADHADFALVSVLLSHRKKTHYVEGNTYLLSHPIIYGPFGQIHSSSYGIVHEPSYYFEDSIFEYENNLYRTKDQNLIWSAITDTVNPSSLKSRVEGLASVVAKQLRRYLNRAPGSNNETKR